MREAARRAVCAGGSTMILIRGARGAGVSYHEATGDTVGPHPSRRGGALLRMRVSLRTHQVKLNIDQWQGAQQVSHPSSDRCGRSPCHGRDRRRLCDVHLFGGVAQTHVSRNMEQHLVSALVLCGHQLYRELGLRRLCRDRLMDRRLRVDDLSAPTGRRATGRSCAGMTVALVPPI